MSVPNEKKKLSLEEAYVAIETTNRVLQAVEELQRQKDVEDKQYQKLLRRRW